MMQPDTARPRSRDRPLVAVVLVVVGALGVASFLLSFRALSAAAEWAGAPPGLRWAVPVFVDGALVAYPLAILVLRGRRQSTVLCWTALAVFTILSIGLNITHAWDAAGPADGIRRLVGAVTAGLIPCATLGVTETVIRLLHAQPGPAESGPGAVAARAPIETTGPQQKLGPVPGPDLMPVPESSALVDEDSEERPGPELVLEPAKEVVASAPTKSVRETVVVPSAETEEIIAWSVARLRAGETVNGPALAEHFGLSPRTGRRRWSTIRTTVMEKSGVNNND